MDLKLDPVGSSESYEIMNWVSVGQQWLVLCDTRVKVKTYISIDRIWHFKTRFDDSGPELLSLCQPFSKSKLLWLLTRFDISRPDLTFQDKNC